MEIHIYVFNFRLEVYQDTISMEVIIITSNPMNNSQYVCSDAISNGGVYCIIFVSEYADLFVMYTYESYTHNRLRKLM